MLTFTKDLVCDLQINGSIELFTDSVGKWAQGPWSEEWADNGTLKDITFLEIFPVVLSFYIWGDSLQNEKKIIFNIDNQSV